MAIQKRKETEEQISSFPYQLSDGGKVVDGSIIDFSVKEEKDATGNIVQEAIKDYQYKIEFDFNDMQWKMFRLDKGQATNQWSYCKDHVNDFVSRGKLIK